MLGHVPLPVPLLQHVPCNSFLSLRHPRKVPSGNIPCVEFLGNCLDYCRPWKEFLRNCRYNHHPCFQHHTVPAHVSFPVAEPPPVPRDCFLSNCLPRNIPCQEFLGNCFHHPQPWKEFLGNCHHHHSPCFLHHSTTLSHVPLPAAQLPQVYHYCCVPCHLGILQFLEFLGKYHGHRRHSFQHQTMLGHVPVPVPLLQSVLCNSFLSLRHRRKVPSGNIPCVEFLGNCVHYCRPWKEFLENCHNHHNPHFQHHTMLCRHFLLDLLLLLYRNIPLHDSLRNRVHHRGPYFQHHSILCHASLSLAGLIPFHSQHCFLPLCHQRNIPSKEFLRYIHHQNHPSCFHRHPSKMLCWGTLHSAIETSNFHLGWQLFPFGMFSSLPALTPYQPLDHCHQLTLLLLLEYPSVPPPPLLLHHYHHHLQPLVTQQFLCQHLLRQHQLPRDLPKCIPPHRHYRHCSFPLLGSRILPLDSLHHPDPSTTNRLLGFVSSSSPS